MSWDINDQIRLLSLSMYVYMFSGIRIIYFIGRLTDDLRCHITTLTFSQSTFRISHRARKYNNNNISFCVPHIKKKIIILIRKSLMVFIPSIYIYTILYTFNFDLSVFEEKKWSRKLYVLIIYYIHMCI